MANTAYYESVFDFAPAKTAQKAKFESLQALRFIAAFLVVLFHLSNSYFIDFGFNKNYFTFGEFGVDIFFVISGFIIAYTAKPKKGIRDFAAKRFARIVPLYWLLTTSVLIASLILPSALNSTQFDVGNYIKSMFFIPYQKENGLVQPMLFLGWTLNYEVFFYLILGVSLLFGRAYLILTCFFIIFVTFLGSLFYGENVLCRFYTNPIMLEFMFGVLLCVLFKSFRFQFYAYAKLTLLPAAVLAGLLIFGDFDVVRPFGQGLIAMSIVAAAITINLPESCVGRALVGLGDASYSLYLSHVFVIQLFTKLCKKYYSTELLYTGSIVTVICCFGLSLVLYHRFELPAQAWLTKRLI